MAAEERHDETGEAEDPDTPLCNVIFANCSVKRKDAWMRRFARTLSRQVIAENENLAVVAEILEAALAQTCASEWEKENLFNIVINDGEKEQMVALLEKLTGRVKDKANSGVGNTTRKSRCLSTKASLDLRSDSYTRVSLVFFPQCMHDTC